MASVSEGGRFGKAPTLLTTTHPGKVMGGFVITGPTLPGQAAEGDTHMCPHCMGHWRIQIGSGIQRGWCAQCNGPTCGQRKCLPCIPWERAMEVHERKQNNINRLHYERTGVKLGNPNSPTPK